MKAENTDKAPTFNLLAPEGVRPQARAGDITAVLLNDNQWYLIEPGSFHLYQSAAKAPAFGPYVTFIPVFEAEPGFARHPLSGTAIEVFPASVVGWAVKQ